MDEEEGDLVAGPVEQWLKQMIKGIPSTPKPHERPRKRLHPLLPPAYTKGNEKDSRESNYR